MTALIVLACIAAYFWIGWRITKAWLPIMWQRARDEWTYDDVVKDSARMQAAVMLLFWPIMLPTRTLWDRLGGSIEKYDPELRKRRLDEREAHIAKLERELGIGDRS